MLTASHFWICRRREKAVFNLKNRSDTNEGGEDEVTVTSELSDHYDKLHARAERTQEQEREDKAAPMSSGDSDKDPDLKDGA